MTVSAVYSINESFGRAGGKALLLVKVFKRGCIGVALGALCSGRIQAIVTLIVARFTVKRVIKIFVRANLNTSFIKSNIFWFTRITIVKIFA